MPTPLLVIENLSLGIYICRQHGLGQLIRTHQIYTIEWSKQTGWTMNDAECFVIDLLFGLKSLRILVGISHRHWHVRVWACARFGLYRN